VSLRERWSRSSGLKVSLLGLVGLLVLGGVAWHFCFFQGCPDVTKLTAYRPGGASVLLDREGRVFADLSPVEGELVRLKALPRHVPEAFIAVEDQRFREHGAVDVRRVFGALWKNLRARDVEEGSSTLTMQLARNVFPDRLPGQKRTLTRKILEVRVAQEIEDQFSKDEILELYLNHIYFGGGATGVEAASRHYFGKPAARLALHEAALLAALPKAPSHYDPRRQPRKAKERRDLVLTLMERQGRVTPEAAAAARKAPLGVGRRPRAVRPQGPRAGYFVEEVRRELEERLGGDVYAEKLKVYTTLDAAAQKAGEEELDRQLRAVESGGLGRFQGPRAAAADGTEEETPYLQGAVVAVEAATGDVLTWVGGRDFRDSRFDRVRGARRQAGSAFKPFVYAAALETGRTMSQMVADEPLRVSLGGGRAWEPKNFDGRFDGNITMRDALVRSKNVPTVRLASDVGVGRVVDLAERAGIEPPIPDEPSMALGTVSVSPLELASAFTTFAGLGQAVRPRTVLKVERENGEVVWEAKEPERRSVLDPAIAYVVTDALKDVLAHGTGQSVTATGFRAPAAGKTGTTNDGADAWFVGYTPEVVAAVWVGFDRQRPIMARATGGRIAAPVWARYMLRLYQGRRTPGDWAPPGNVVEGLVDPANGMLLASGCRPWNGVAYRELFVRGSQPSPVCPAQGLPQASDVMASLDLTLPDYEEGLQTGLTPEMLPSPLPDERLAEAAGEELPEDLVGPPAERAEGLPATPSPAAEADTPPLPRTAAPRPSPTALASSAPRPRPTASAPAPAPEATPAPPEAPPSELPRASPAPAPSPSPPV
jgi:penicillin-binding protein 1A